MSAEGPTNGPSWMDEAPVSQPMTTRTGAASQKSRGIPNVVFFGGIVLAVAVAGYVGISIWGPEKEIKGRSHLATNPPPPLEMPSLPPDPSASAAAAETASAAPVAEPAPTESAPVEAPKPKPRGRTKKPK